MAAKRRIYSFGFSLLELMVGVAIVGILAAIAIPAYTDYIQTARYNAARANTQPLKIAIEDFRLDNGNYGAGGANKAALLANYTWQPEGDQAAWAYSVTVPGANAASNYDMTVTHVASGNGVTCPTNIACTEF